MSELLHDLLGIVKVAVISGGDWPQFKKQLLSNLPYDERLANLSLRPTCGTKFFQYAGDWKKIYSEDLTADEKTNEFVARVRSYCAVDHQLPGDLFCVRRIEPAIDVDCHEFVLSPLSSALSSLRSSSISACSVSACEWNMGHFHFSSCP
jgi:hypothetical protein